jgi:hypothetical protein
MDALDTTIAALRKVGISIIGVIPGAETGHCINMVNTQYTHALYIYI